MAKRSDKPEIVDYSIRENSDTVFDDVTWQFIDKECISIIDATGALNGVNPNYTRRILLMGRLEGIKVEYKGYDKWHITLVSIAWYKKHGRRSDTLRRHNFYIKLVDQERVEQLLETNDIEYRLELAYQNGKEE